MSGHTYRAGTRGRSIASAPGVGGTTFTAHLACSACDKRGERRLRAIMPPVQIDRKFMQAGWSLDPHLCHDCRAAAAQEKSMATKPSTAAIKAQAKMFSLLGQHFNPETGAYAPGWSDVSIAKETSLAVETIAEFRKEAFGDLKAPPELVQMQNDLAATRQLLDETVASIKMEIDRVGNRLADISKRWAA